MEGSCSSKPGINSVGEKMLWGLPAEKVLAGPRGEGPRGRGEKGVNRPAVGPDPAGTRGQAITQNPAGLKFFC